MILCGDWSADRTHVCLQVPEGELCLANLEGPILAPNHGLDALPKAGPVLAQAEPPEGFALAYVLANNHTMDYGIPGLRATLECLDDRGIAHCGGGLSMAAAREPVTFEEEGAKIGVLSCCEAQFGVAGEREGGVAECGSWVYEAIRRLRASVDAVVVSTHAAMEDSPWPSPFLQDLYRSYIDQGATIVHGHHSHVPQGYEHYRNGLILYGLGNFVVNPSRWLDYPNGLWSIGVRLSFPPRIDDGRMFAFRCRSSGRTDGIIVAAEEGVLSSDRAEYLRNCIAPLSDRSLLEALWQETSVRAYRHHMASYLGYADSRHARPRRLWQDVLSFLRPGRRNRGRHAQDMLLKYHLFRCESHRQVVATALGVLSGTVEDERTGQTRELADRMMPWSLGYGAP